MGNTGIIKGKGTNLGLYLHWNGGYDSVLAFTQYCKLKGYRSPENDCYGLARLCQVVTNFFGGGLSVGILNMTGAEHVTKEIAIDYGGDNGIYELVIDENGVGGVVKCNNVMTGKRKFRDDIFKELGIDQE